MRILNLQIFFHKNFYLIEKQNKQNHRFKFLDSGFGLTGTFSVKSQESKNKNATSGWGQKNSGEPESTRLNFC